MKLTSVRDVNEACNIRGQSVYIEFASISEHGQLQRSTPIRIIAAHTRNGVLEVRCLMTGAWMKVDIDSSRIFLD